MGHPKKYKHLHDATPRLTAEGGTAYMPSTLEFKGLPSRYAAAFYRQGRMLVHPVPAGFNDPLSIMCVVDCLLRLEHDTIIRARDLAKVLSDEYRHMTWPTISVGRILSDLAEAALAAELSPPPLTREEDRRGKYYVVHPSQINWGWLLGARVKLGDLAEAQVDAERNGHGQSRVSFPFDALAGVVIVGAEDRAAA